MKLLAQIKDYITQMETLNYDNFPKIQDYFAKQEELMAQIQAWSDSVTGEGVQVCKMLNFGVADGHATYIISKVNKTTVEVIHVPFCDAYQFQGVYQDANGKLKLPYPVAAQQCRMAAFWSKAMDKQAVAV